MKLQSLELVPSYEAPSSWWQHVPIAHALIELNKPGVVVELGSHYGVSFFSFCEAAEKYSRNSYIYAIDSWEGDKHAGFYGESVYSKVSTHAELHHKQRATLLRCKFDEAVDQFEDNSIDLLHIDGLHTYEAVKHDWETWFTKLKVGGSILLHDWNVRDKGFGVWKLWGEIKKDNRFRCLQVANGHGLAIATYANETPEWHRILEENIEAIKCKGLLLEKIRDIQGEKELKELKDCEQKKHIRNLEEILKTREEELDRASGMIRKLQENIFRKAAKYIYCAINRIK